MPKNIPYILNDNVECQLQTQTHASAAARFLLAGSTDTKVKSQKSGRVSVSDRKPSPQELRCPFYHSEQA